MRNSHMLCKPLKIGAILLCSSAALPALAQDAATDGVVLDTVRINAQDPLSGPALAYPSAQSRISGEQAESRATRSARDLSRALPNVTGFDAGGNRMTTFTVRGMREFGYQSTPGVMPALAYYVDDVPALTTLARASVFSNVDSITLLKGPQNTAYGDSRPGGTIDIRSKEPGDKLAGYAGIGFGSDAAKELKAGVSGPMGNDLYFSFDGQWHARDGFYDNTLNGDSYGDKRAAAAKARLTWRPSDTTQVDLFLQHERFTDQTDPFIPLSQLQNGDPYDVAYDDPGQEKIGQDLIALRARQSFDAFDLLSVTSYRRSTWEFTNDGDMGPGPFDPANPFSRIIGYTAEEVRSVTQEFRLKSNDTGARLQWSAGLFAARTEMDVTPGYYLGDGSASLVNANNVSRDLALFGELRYAIAPTVELAGGLRYQIAKREASNDQPAPYISSGSHTDRELLPSVSVTYRPNADLTAFAKYSRGFRPGGYNAHKLVTTRDEYGFDAEISDNFEIGFQSTALAPGLTLGGSLFYSRYDDYQVLNQIAPGVFAVNSAQEAKTWGAEIQADYALSDGLRLFGSVGVTHAEYDRFSNGFGDWSGSRIPFVPRYTANYGIEYQADSGLFAAVQGRLTGEYQLNDANTLHQGTAHVVDAQIGWRKDAYEVVLYGQNIFDKRYVANMYDFASSSNSAMGSLGDPATYGLRLNYRF